MAKFSKTYNGANKVRGEAPDLEMPNLDPELQTEFGLDNDPGYTDPERDEYWK